MSSHTNKQLKKIIEMFGGLVKSQPKQRESVRLLWKWLNCKLNMKDGPRRQMIAENHNHEQQWSWGGGRVRAGPRWAVLKLGCVCYHLFHNACPISRASDFSTYYPWNVRLYFLPFLLNAWWNAGWRVLRLLVTH